MNFKILFLSLVATLAIFILACNLKKETTQTTHPPTEIISESEPVAITSGSADSDNNNPTMTQSKHIKNLQTGIIDFAFNLFRKQSLEKHTESFCVSPVSLSLALGMTYAGARGETAKQMSEVMGYPVELNQFLLQIKEYYSTLKASEGDKNPEFAIANKIYLEQTFVLLKEFVQAMTENFGGAFKLVDFITKFKEAEKEINAWVEQKTRTRIKDLIPSGLLDASTVMVLVNAIYFKDEWQFAFNEKLTTEMPFYSEVNNKVDLKFMKQRIQAVRYAKHKQWQVLELPYKGKNFSLLIILPNQSSSSDIHTKIPEKEDYMTMISALSNQNVYIELPKFKTESSFMLETMMSEMGMPAAFSNNADFSGMSGRKDLKISKIIQKVFFELTEKGTEAAAATAVIMVRSSAVQKPEQAIRFIANRPFIYVLKENNFNTPLFIGQFTGI